MVKLPWFPFYSRDFFEDERVKFMSNAQVGIYLKLLHHQWGAGTIPPTLNTSPFLDLLNPHYDIQQSCNDFTYVFEKCFLPHPTIPNRFYNTRLEKIRREQIRKDEENHKRAMKAARASKVARQAQLQAQHKLSTSRAIQSQSQSQNQREIKTPQPPVVAEGDSARAVEDWFEDWWKAMPARGGKRLYKGKAYEFYLRYVKPEERAGALVAAKAYAAHCLKEDRLPVDPMRFLFGQKGEMWREFLPAIPTPKSLSAQPVIPPVPQVGEDPPPEVAAILARIGVSVGSPVPRKPYTNSGFSPLLGIDPPDPTLND